VACVHRENPDVPAEPSRPRVAAIVPAYNEQETLADVLSALKATAAIDELLVVSDGSTDETVAIARALQVRAIHLRRNAGKAMAMAIGVAHTEAPVLVFVDGDILNLSAYLLDRLIEPVIAGRSDMNIGVRNRGWLINAVHRHTGPLLSGIRCLRREVFLAVPEDYLKGYTVETALNWACDRLGRRRSTTVLHGLKHRVKEKKRGLAAGTRARLEMFYRVFVAWLGLTIKNPGVRNGAPLRARPELESIDS
jgi:glycosyltransferase involved in cell wall biosynthesis